MLNVANDQESVTKPESHHCAPVRTIVTERHEMTRAGEDVEEREPLCVGDGTVPRCSDHGRRCGGSFNIETGRHGVQPARLDGKSVSQRDTSCAPTFTAGLLKRPRYGNTHVSGTDERIRIM